MLPTRTQMRAGITIFNGAENFMNQINIESNVVDSEINELLILNAAQTEEAMTELNSAQLSLVGGGLGVAVLI